MVLRHLRAVLDERCPPQQQGWGRAPRTAMVVEMDCRLNDCPPPAPEGVGAVDVEEYPTIALYPAGALHSPVVYTGAISVQRLLDFLQSEASAFAAGEECP
mmetsp:Transcript_16811/g.53238  ORF Transcript_16811/g.53238 Transcript_16811/m.53238 type:complete len:101 (+) Transcript_16811:165-467(+)